MDPDTMWISVDPGLETGLAFWKGDQLIRFESLRSRPHFDWNVRCNSTIGQIVVAVARRYPYTEFYIEEPAYMPGAAHGAVAAGGALVKLSILSGRIFESLQCARTPLAEGTWVPVRKWKGTLPKSICVDRIRRKMPMHFEPTTSHAWDAIGIGLYVLGEF